MTDSSGLADPAGSAMARLPAEPDAFIGREQDLARLRRLLRTTRMITLCATCGMGKTRLATRLAREIAEDFDDGVALIKLADLERPELVLGHLADCLGIVQEHGRDPLDTLTDALRARHMLLVLDNCEHLIDSVAEISARLLADCPDLRILTTSREPLHVPGESIWRVAALPMPSADDPAAIASAYDAVRLFAVRAAAQGTEFRLNAANVHDVVRVCWALDGMPLAIELAAARIPALSPAEIADRLDDRFRLLTAGDRTAPPRQRALWAAVDWSHDLLTPREQVLLRRLAVFAEGWTLEAAETVCTDQDLPRVSVLEALTSLVEKSLVFCVQRPGEESRYGLLQTISEYAAQKLAAAAESLEIGRKHRDWYLTVSERRMRISLGRHAGRGLPDPFTPMERDCANVLAALNWSLDQGEAEPGLRLSYAMALYWMPRGRLAEAYSWMDRFLAIPGATVAKAVRGRVLACRGQFGVELGHLSAATRDASPALELCREGSDISGAGAALYVLGMALLRSGDLDGARIRFAEGAAVAAAVQEPWGGALAHGALAAVATRLHDWEDADRHYKEALTFADAHRVPFVRAQVLIGMGILAQNRGDLPLARERLEEALSLLRGHDYRIETSRCLIALARLAIAEQDLPAVRRHIAEVLPLCRLSGQRLALARGLEVAAAVASLEDDHGRTLRLAGAAAELREAVAGDSAEERFRTLFDEARDHLGPEEAQRLWQAGRAEGPDAAIALALTPTGLPPEPASPDRQAPTRRPLQRPSSQSPSRRAPAPSRTSGVDGTEASPPSPDPPTDPPPS